MTNPRGFEIFILVSICLAGQEPSFKAGVSMVEVDAQVIGTNGVVDGLGIHDFVVTENRRPVRLRECVQEETALDLVLLFELSKIMVSNHKEITLAAELALTQLREGDRVAVMSFADSTRVEQELTGNLNEMKRRLRLGLENASFTSKPFVLPAAEASARYLAAQPEPHHRRVVLMFTGDAGWGLEQNHARAAAKLWETETILSAVVIPNEGVKQIV